MKIEAIQTDLEGNPVNSIDFNIEDSELDGLTDEEKDSRIDRVVVHKLAENMKFSWFEH